MQCCALAPSTRKARNDRPQAPTPDSNVPHDHAAAPAPQPAAAAAPLSEAEDNQWASFAHFGGILGFLPSLIIWLVFKDRGAVTNVEAQGGAELPDHADRSATSISSILVIAIIGVALLHLVPRRSGSSGVVSCSIIAFLQAASRQRRRHYRYPFALRLIK